MNYTTKTYGCKLNQSETRELEKILSGNFNKSSEKKADLVLINSCGIIKKTELKVIKEIKKMKKKGKRVVVTGCLPAMNEELKGLADLVISGNDPNKFKKKISSLFELKEEKANFSMRKESASSVILPISTGCLGNCSYCSAKIARGKLQSYSERDIIKKVKESLNLGYKEIQLTSQDLGIYGMDKGSSALNDLLNNLISIDKKFRIKLGMMNPGFILDFFEDLLDLFQSNKLYNFLHLPVQSGDDEILKVMRRQHTVGDFINFVELIKNKYEDFLISTDIIVGFPGETEDSFNKTLHLIRKTRPHIVNITRYSKRKGTDAAKMKDMPSKIKKERSRKLTKLTKKIRLEDNQKMTGRQFEALIFREGKKDTKLARIPNGKAVVLNSGKVGTFKKIKIIDFKHNYLIGKIC